MGGFIMSLPEGKWEIGKYQEKLPEDVYTALIAIVGTESIIVLLKARP